MLGLMDEKISPQRFVEVLVVLRLC